MIPDERFVRKLVEFMKYLALASIGVSIGAKKEEEEEEEGWGNIRWGEDPWGS